MKVRQLSGFPSTTYIMLTAGKCFILDGGGVLYLKMNDGKSVSLENGVIASFSPEAIVRIVDAEVVVDN